MYFANCVGSSDKLSILPSLQCMKIIYQNGWQLSRNLHSNGSQKKNLYDILQVKSDASLDQIKESYYKLSMQYHPDQNKGDESATEKFREINAAYEVLGNLKNRRSYDQSAGRRGHSYAKPPPTTSRGWDYREFNESQYGQHWDKFDFYEWYRQHYKDEKLRPFAEWLYQERNRKGEGSKERSWSSDNFDQAAAFNQWYNQHFGPAMNQRAKFYAEQAGRKRNTGPRRAKERFEEKAAEEDAKFDGFEAWYKMKFNPSVKKARDFAQDMREARAHYESKMSGEEFTGKSSSSAGKSFDDWYAQHYGHTMKDHPPKSFSEWLRQENINENRRQRLKRIKELNVLVVMIALTLIIMPSLLLGDSSIHDRPFRDGYGRDTWR